MEEDSILQQPTDRRLGSDLPNLGPPGAEMDFEIKKEEKETSSSKSSRRKSPSPQSKKRKSPSTTSRSRHSPSPPPSSRRHRSPTPPSRRNRFRYSPDRRGRYDRRRSPDRDRRRSPYRSSGRGRWSPKKKPNSPPSPPPATVGNGNIQSNMMMNSAQPPPGVMLANVPPPTGQYMQAAMQNQMYGADAYAATYAGGYGVPPPHTGFAPQPDAYGMQTAGNYNPAYPPPNAWGAHGHDAYAQHAWMQQQTTIPDPNQMQQQTQAMPPQSRDPQQQMPLQQDSAPHSVHLGSSENKAGTVESSAAHDAAVAQEAENQREELKKQRSSYVEKNSLLKKELKMLRDQRKDLESGAAPPSPTTKGFIDENDKLQNQIMMKISTIKNVIEMLTGVIGEEHVEREDSAVDEATEKAKLTKTGNSGGTAPWNPTSQQKPRQHRTTSTSSNSSGSSSGSTSSSSSSGSSSSSDNEEENNKKPVANSASVTKGANNDDDDDDDDTPERLKHKVMESLKSKQRMLSGTAQRGYPAAAEKIKVEKVSPGPLDQQRFNYAFYDPEMHWCQRCDVFPKTAKDYLNHLHSKEHMDKESTPETPWHATVIEDKFPNYENAQTKRMPIRGITFFVPATAWYCKLCSIWMGDLHCASMHLKSRQHSNKYTIFLERNPNFEMNWLADRQRVFNKKSIEASASQITAVSTTAAEDRENRKSKKNDEKANKKHKRHSEKKDKKKKKKRSKKRKKMQESSSDSSSSDSSSSDESEKVIKKKKPPKVISPIKELDNPNPAASIRVAMRKTESGKLEEDDVQVIEAMEPVNTKSNTTSNSNNKQHSSDNWSNVSKPHAPVQLTIQAKADDVIINQWNAVQPVISDNEKKLLEQLKGKLKTTKPTEPSKEAKDTAKSLKSDVKENRDNKVDRSGGRREKDLSNERPRKRSRSRSGSRSLTRSRSRGRDWRRARSRSLRRRDRSRGRRSRSRSRGRYSPVNRIGRRRRSISRSRRRRTHSRSRNRRGRRNLSRSRSRSHSETRAGRAGSVSGSITSASRIEKPVLQHSEFRPRIPEKEKEKEKDKKSSKNDDKKDSKKSSKSTSNAANASTTAKKLPFIGKMPVFKKQTTGPNENEISDVSMATDAAVQNITAPMYITQQSLTPGIHPLPPPRLPAPTAEQIKMAMMEDMYGNAPPFHPEAGIMHAAMDYDDLMPDPVQFVNLMAQAPPPPAEEEPNNSDVLPPGIDEMETEEFVAKPVSDGDGDNASGTEGEGGSALPKDLEEALNIIFPGDRKSEGDDEANGNGGKLPAGETQIIVEEPVMQMEELYKEGIHMVSIEETSIMAIDEASRLSMNEPLIFNNVSNNGAVTTASERKDKKNEEHILSKDAPSNQLGNNKGDAENGSSMITLNTKSTFNDGNKSAKTYDEKVLAAARPVSPPTIPDDIPMPPVTQRNQKDSAAAEFDLDDIPHPPAPLSESEKQRRQEELDDLAMLGIDADDMAAQRM